MRYFQPTSLTWWAGLLAMLTGIASGDVTDRASMIEYFKTYDGEGLAKSYKWDSSGELAVANPWLYQVQ